jgi:hypothetical protein
MDEKEIAKKLKEGGVLTRVSFEVIGNPKEHIESSLRDFLANIEKEPTLKIIQKEIGEAEELEGGLFSTYAEAEILFDKLEGVVWLCVNFMPASVEVIAPEELKFSDKDLTLWFNDILAKLHEVTTGYRTLSTKEELFVKSMNAMVHNALLLAAENYHTPEEISGKIGVDVEQLKQFLDANVKNGKLEKLGEEYHLKK